MNDITVSGYDPFASPYDSHDPAIVGSLWGSLKKAAKVAVQPITSTVKAHARVLKGDFAGAARGIWNETKESLNHSVKLANSKEGRYALAGAAMVFPPAAPALAGVAAAAKVLRTAQSKDPVKRAAARLTLKATQKLAATDKGARMAWTAVRFAQGLHKRGSRPERALTRLPMYGVLTLSSGQRLPGYWRQA